MVFFTIISMCHVFFSIIILLGASLDLIQSWAPRILLFPPFWCPRPDEVREQNDMLGNELHLLNADQEVAMQNRMLLVA